MGFPDIYCALCGVLITHHGIQFRPEEYDQARFAENDTSWMSDVWLIRPDPTSDRQDSFRASLLGPVYLLHWAPNKFIFFDDDYDEDESNEDESDEDESYEEIENYQEVQA